MSFGSTNNVKKKDVRFTACYGPEDGKAQLYCAEHARPHGYLNTVSKRCSVESCTNVATWGVDQLKLTVPFTRSLGCATL